MTTSKGAAPHVTEPGYTLKRMIGFGSDFRSIRVKAARSCSTLNERGEKTMTTLFILCALYNAVALHALMTNHNETLVSDDK